MSDVSKTNDLIAEARQCHQARGWSKDPLVDKLENLANRLADALEAATRERDAAVAAIERVRAIHTRGETRPGEYFCTYPACESYWPCPTIQALDGAPEPEGGVITSPTWQDGCPMTVNELPNGGPENYKGHIDCQKGA